MVRGVAERTMSVPSASAALRSPRDDGPLVQKVHLVEANFETYLERARLVIDTLEARAQKAEELAREAHRQRRHTEARLGAIAARLANVESRAEAAERRADRTEQHAREVESRAVQVIRAADARIRQDMARLTRLREGLLSVLASADGARDSSAIPGFMITGKD